MNVGTLKAALEGLPDDDLVYGQLDGHVPLEIRAIDPGDSSNSEDGVIASIRGTIWLLMEET